MHRGGPPTWPPKREPSSGRHHCVRIWGDTQSLSGQMTRDPAKTDPLEGHGGAPTTLPGSTDLGRWHVTRGPRTVGSGLPSHGLRGSPSRMEQGRSEGAQRAEQHGRSRGGWHHGRETSRDNRTTWRARHVVKCHSAMAHDLCSPGISDHFLERNTVWKGTSMGPFARCSPRALCDRPPLEWNASCGLGGAYADTVVRSGPSPCAYEELARDDQGLGVLGGHLALACCAESRYPVVDSN